MYSAFVCKHGPQHGVAVIKGIAQGFNQAGSDFYSQAAKSLAIGSDLTLMEK
jgi:hypothetical protein